MDARATVGTFGHSPAVYRSVSPLRAPVSQVRSTPGALGLCGVRVDGRFGVRLAGIGRSLVLLIVERWEVSRKK
jgi:hypothetical protein